MATRTSGTGLDVAERASRSPASTTSGTPAWGVATSGASRDGSGTAGVGRRNARGGDSRRRLGQAVAVTAGSPCKVVVLAPMPLELQAIVDAFALRPSEHDGHWSGRLEDVQVEAVHIGMGPQATREALLRLADLGRSDNRPLDHVMIAGICGGLDPDLPVGTLLNPEAVVEYPSGIEYPHNPPGETPRVGKLVTTERVILDKELSRRFFAQGCLGVDMETSAVAEVCGSLGWSWSVYRCIGDRYVDDLLDERVVSLANPDGSGDPAALKELLAAEPEVAARLEQLAKDASLAARRAAEAAVEGCRALAGRP